MLCARFQAHTNITIQIKRSQFNMTQEVSFSSCQKNSFKKMQLNMSTKVGNYVEVSTCHFLRHLCLVSVGLKKNHYDGVIMGATASQITSLTIVYSIVYSDADQRKHQSSASLAFVWGIHRGPVNSPHKWPVTRKMFPFDDVIMMWPFMRSYPALVSAQRWKVVV